MESDTGETEKSALSKQGCKAKGGNPARRVCAGEVVGQMWQTRSEHVQAPGFGTRSNMYFIQIVGKTEKHSQTHTHTDYKNVVTHIPTPQR